MPGFGLLEVRGIDGELEYLVDCEKAWTEASWLAARRRHLTTRARAAICRRVGQENAWVALCARSFGVG